MDRSGPFLLLAALGGLLLAWWVVVAVVIPVGRLLAVLRRMAGGDFRPVILPGGSSLLVRGAASDLRVLAETLAHQKEMLEKEEFSLSMILGSMDEAVVITGMDLRIRLINAAAEKMFNLRGPMTGVPLPEAFRSHELQALVEKAAATGELQRGELTLGVSGRAEPCHLTVTTAVLKESAVGRNEGLLLVLHDITRVRELEAVRREFIANVSHEFRTPLSVINGYLETLEEGGVGKEMLRRSVEVMRRHCGRLNRLIEDLLTISRMEEKGVTLEKAPTDLAALLKVVVQHMEGEIQRRGVHLEVAYPPDVRPVEVDAFRIEQALSNLLANAIRHGAAAGGRVGITISADEHEIAVCVRDNGPGIPLADQRHIFERFYRVGGDRARQTGGTGLGLSIVKNIAAAHGGRVTLRSIPGEGSAFTLHLPAGT
jgi:two-component system phosphate regulon sensor histidine kinase PhoR